MRLNKYIASASLLSRRAADQAIADRRVTLNGQITEAGSQVKPTDTVCLDGVKLTPCMQHTTIMLNKPVGYVCSRSGQGSKTIFELLPEAYQHLQPVGRLDKDSSGLLLLTDDGDLANQLTHPSRGKVKVYEVTLNKPLQPLHQQMISDYGITLKDGLSRFTVTKLETRDMRYESRKENISRSNYSKVGSSDVSSTHDSVLMTHDSHTYEVRMQEGRNRQIRRTFAALGYTVTTLHRTHFGSYNLGNALPKDIVIIHSTDM
ncbi:rRNA pseudouridine synthase [Candidatus Saccharibacteria bacterium]|nr:MAG: rRNA pseudouridine synthase [Candidatus Saccharibacteria bacterium]